MPLLQVNQIKNVLKESGISSKDDIKSILAREALGPDDLISELGSVVRGADSSAMKLKGIETALKLNGLLRNDSDGAVAPIVNIIIHDSEFSQGINPILLTRES